MAFSTRQTLASTGRTAHSAPKMDRQSQYHHAIGDMRKNSMERVKVSLDEYNGVDLVNVAVIRDSVGYHALNKMRDTARYVSVQTRQLPELIKLLQQAELRAKELGLLPRLIGSGSTENG